MSVNQELADFEMNKALHLHDDFRNDYLKNDTLCLLAAVKAAKGLHGCINTETSRGFLSDDVELEIVRHIADGDTHILPQKVTPEIQADFDTRVSKVRAFLDAAQVPYTEKTVDDDLYHAKKIIIDTSFPGCKEAICRLMEQHKDDIVGRYGVCPDIIFKPDATLLDTNQAAKEIAGRIAQLQDQVRVLTNKSRQLGIHATVVEAVRKLNLNSTGRVV